MKQFKVKFKDAFDVQHEGALFEMQYGNINLSKMVTIGTSNTESESVSVNYMFKYWHSEQSKSDGSQHMILTGLDGQTMFGTFPSGESEIGDLEEYCIKNLIEVVLPGIDPNFEVISQSIN